MVAGIQANLKPKVVTSKSTSLAMERPNFIQEAKIFGKFLLAPAEESGANPIQKLLPVGLIAFGLPALPALLFKNWVSTQNAKLPDNPFWADIVTKLAYAYDPLFQAITFINLAIAFLTPSPGRVVTYGLLALANQFIAGPNNKKSLDNGVALRAINEQIEIREDKLKDAKVSSEEKNKIKAELQELYKQEAEINKSNLETKSWIQFYGNSIYNFIMSFSFLASIPVLAKACRFTNLEPRGRTSAFDKEKWTPILYAEHDIKKILMGGAKVYDEDIREGRVIEDSYLKVFGKQLKRELVTFKETLLELKENIIHPERSQATIFGRNKKLEAELKEIIEKKEEKLNRKLTEAELIRLSHVVRASGGLGPASMNALNVVTRMSIFASALTAFFTLGINAFAPKNSSIVNSNNSNLNGLTVQNILGTTALATSDGLTNTSRFLSGVSSVLTALNPGMGGINGGLSSGLMALGGGLSLGSVTADKLFNQPGFGLTLQFISALFLWLSSGFGNINKGFSNFHTKEVEKLNNIASFNRQRELAKV